MNRLTDFYKLQEIISDDGDVSFFVVRHRKTGKKYAVKGMNKKRANLYHLIQEVQIFSLIKEHPHPNIMVCQEIFEDPNEIFLVHEYLPGGFQLAHFCAKAEKEKDIKRVFWQVLKGISHLHKLGIVHRDLNMETVYVGKKGSAAGSQRDVKLVNFSISSLYSYNTYLNTFCKSPFFSSPEMCKGLPYFGPEVDTWAAGVILYCLVYKRYPFAPDDTMSVVTSVDSLTDENDAADDSRKRVTVRSDETDAQKWMRDLGRKIVSGEVTFPQDEKEDSAVKRLIRQILDVDPNKRPTLTQIMEDDWFKDLRMKELKRRSSCLKKLSFFS